MITISIHLHCCRLFKGGVVGAGLSVPFFAQLQGLLVTGGPVVWILAVFSAVAMTIILVKMWQFMLARAESTADVDAALSLWKKGDRRNAVRALNQKKKKKKTQHNQKQHQPKHTHHPPPPPQPPTPPTPP